MRTRSANGIKKAKIDPLNSEAPPHPKESITKRNNRTEGAKVGWGTCRAKEGAELIATNPDSQPNAERVAQVAVKSNNSKKKTYAQAVSLVYCLNSLLDFMY